MEKEQISVILESQRKYFESGATLDVDGRIATLKKLRSLIFEYESEIVDALWADFHKPEFEALTNETRFVIGELNLAIRNLRKWARPKRVATPIVHFLSRSYITPQPYGNVLVLSPWNFPFQLAFVPLIGALAAGNSVILKPSGQVPNTMAVMKKIIGSFPPEQLCLIEGDHSTSEFLLEQKFDYIFFTGSPKIGKMVMHKAADQLIPVSLELGGKNPCVVAADARLDYAAKRIVWGKFFNCGQACVSPDYLLVDKKVKEAFLELLVKEIRVFYGDNPMESNDFARVISRDSAKRLFNLMHNGKIVHGGTVNESERFVAPTIITGVKPDDPIMEDEIFGPLLPVIEFENFEEIYPIIERHPNPLASYIFSSNRKVVDSFLSRVRAGTSAVNDTVMQFASAHLPFGGVGNSGIGKYHGKKSFDTFSNMRSVLEKSNAFDIWLRYPPYSKLKTKIVMWLMR